jgi:hypothetical protein
MSKTITRTVRAGRLPPDLTLGLSPDQPVRVTVEPSSLDAERIDALARDMSRMAEAAGLTPDTLDRLLRND